MKPFPFFLFLFLSLGLTPILTLADHPTLSLEDGSPGPVTTISAIPLPQGKLSSAVVSQFIFNHELSDAELRRYSLLDESVHSVESVISTAVNTAYGVTDDFTLGFSLPYIWRRNLREAAHHHEEAAEHGHGHEEEGHGSEEEAGEVERLGNSDGLGDVTLFSQFRFLNDEANDRHLALIAGLKTPTGRTDARTRGGELFEAEHQPGSGSWDPLVGLAFTQHWGQWSLDANGLYTFVTDGTQDTNLGDIVNYNLAISYRAIGAHNGHDGHHDHAGHAGAACDCDGKSVIDHHDHPTTLDLILEANGDWRDKINAGGTEDDNTGGNLIYFSGGARLAWGEGWAATFSAGIPVIEDLNGIQSEPKARVLVGISKSF